MYKLLNNVPSNLWLKCMPKPKFRRKPNNSNSCFILSNKPKLKPLLKQLSKGNRLSRLNNSTYRR